MSAGPRARSIGTPQAGTRAGTRTTRLRITQHRFLDRRDLRDALDNFAVVVGDGRLRVLQAATREHADDLLPRCRDARDDCGEPRGRGRLAEDAFLGAEQSPGGDQLIVEKYIAGKELTCAVRGEEAFGVIEIVPMVRFYDYEAKYAPGGSKHLLPAPVSPFVYQEVRRLSLAAHRALGCRGVSRADFRYDDRIEGTGGLVCLEVNTQPGMTETSLVPELAAHAGITFDELVQWMIEDASLNR